MTKIQSEKLYKRYDMQDESDFHIETLQQMRDWLSEFWNDNPDDEMTDEEHEEMIKAISEADEDEIFDRLGGIDYSYYELDENGEEIIPETTMLQTNLSWGYCVKSEKFTVGNKSYVEMTLRRKSKISEAFMVMLDKWEEEHEKYVNILLEELKNYTPSQPRVQIID